MNHPIQPLLHNAGNRVLVYGQPICTECGHTIEAIGPDRWRHAAAGHTPSRPSKWLSPSINDLRACRTYKDFATRYPWAVRSSTRSVLATSLATSRGQWREGMSRLERYRLELAALTRRTPCAASRLRCGDGVLGRAAPDSGCGHDRLRRASTGWRSVERVSSEEARAVDRGEAVLRRRRGAPA
jgi:hypothetical protein